MEADAKSRSSVGKWVLGAALIYFGLVGAVGPISRISENLLRENYEWRAIQALSKSDLAKAEEIIRARIVTEDYDFYAQYLLAETLIRSDRFDEAIKVLKDSIEKERAVSGRNVYNRGMNPHKSRALLAKALGRSGRPEEARLMDIEAQKKWSVSSAGILADAK